MEDANENESNKPIHFVWKSFTLFICLSCSLPPPELIVMIELQSIHALDFFPLCFRWMQISFYGKFGWNWKFFFFVWEMPSQQFFVLHFYLVPFESVAVFCVALSTHHVKHYHAKQARCLGRWKSAMQFIWFVCACVCVSASLVWLTLLSLVYDFLCFCATVMVCHHHDYCTRRIWISHNLTQCTSPSKHSHKNMLICVLVNWLLLLLASHVQSWTESNGKSRQKIAEHTPRILNTMWYMRSERELRQY